MIIYHGTNTKNLESILKEGIKPRLNKKSNWDTGIGRSRKDLVYLTTCYAPYYAYSSCKKDEKGVILKLDIDETKVKLYPDEEFLFDCLRKNINGRETKEVIKEYNRINPKKHNFINVKTGEKATWQDSLKYLGTVSADFIPREMIIGYHIDEPKNRYIFNCDPCINQINFMLCSAQYKKFIESLSFIKV